MGNKKKISSVFFVAILVFLAFATLPFATASSDDVIYVPDNYATIQEAVDAASPGDTIIVRDGTYTENIKVTKRLTIKSEKGCENCIVQAAYMDHVFKITADYVNISGFTVTGATGTHKKAGIYLYHADYCSIFNNNASNNDRGISLDSSGNNNLTGNIANLNNYYGIGLGCSSSNNDLIGNVASGNNYGIWLSGSGSNDLTGNTASGNSHYGIYLDCSSNNDLTDNIMSGNNYNFGVRGGGSPSYYIQNIDTSNLVNGKTVYYWVDRQDEQVPDDAGFVGIVSSTNITVRDLTLTNNSMGVLFAYTDNSRIENVTASSNNYGIWLDSSSNNNLTGNNASGNNCGIYLHLYPSNNLTGNIASNNDWCGIYLSDSSNNNLTDNIASDNVLGIYLYYSSNNALTNNTMSGNDHNFFLGVYAGSLHGFIQNIDTSNLVNGKPVYYWVDRQDEQVPDDAGFVGIVNSTNITVRDLTLTNNSMGVLFAYTDDSRIENITISDNNCGIWLSYSSNNTLTDNTASNNNYGISLCFYSSNNLINNNYFNNTNNAYDDGNNIWNVTKTAGTNIIGGSYLGGNYWSDYTGDDLGEDGLGDTLLPYNSSGSIQSGGDWLPLVKTEREQYTKTDIGATSTITPASPTDLAAYLPPEYTDTDINDAIVLNVNVTDITPDTTDDAYADITINVGSMDIETCKVFKTDFGFLPEVEDITMLPTVSGEPAFSRDLVNKTVTVRLYVGDPLLGVIPAAVEPLGFDTGEGTYPSIRGTHNGTIIPSRDINISKLYTYPCAGTGGHSESIKLYENVTLIANGSWVGYEGDWHNITIDNDTGASYAMLFKNHMYNYTIVTGSYPQIIHSTSKEVTGGTITCTSFVDVNGKVYYDWIPAIRLE